jgi:hypothetical protein
VREQTRRAAVFASMAVARRAPMSHDDDQMAAQFERIIRRVKQSMHYRGSYSTRDILGSLVARWLHSGEWQRLKALPAEERRIGESVRRFILDRIAGLRRRGDRAELAEEEIVLPDEATLAELVELAELRVWIEARVADLERGEIDPRIKIPLARPHEVGRALRLHLVGRTQREIGAELGVSLGAANKRIAEGTSYLVVLAGIESGLGGEA